MVARRHNRAMEALHLTSSSNLLKAMVSSLPLVEGMVLGHPLGGMV